jgi:hypothetical protein
MGTGVKLEIRGRALAGRIQARGSVSSDENQQPMLERKTNVVDLAA